MIQVFGIPALRWHGKTKTLAADQLAWLCVILACSPHGVTRDALCQLFWSDSSQSRARANLRQTLLKFKASELGTFLRLEAEMVFLDVSSDWQGFWASLARQDDLTALDLARDEFLRQFESNNNQLLSWREQQRSKVYEAWSLAVLRVVPNTEPDQASGLWEALLEGDLLSEEHLQLALAWCHIHAKNSLGQRWYKRFALLLEHELQCLPSQKTRDLLAETTAASANIGFLGRSAELSYLSLLAQKTNCISIIGFAGSGKTRLAHEVLHLLETNYLLVALHQVIETDSFLAQIAQALGLQGSHLEETIPAALEARGGQILLDNAEHLSLKSRILLETWVDTIPNLQWWITSRQAVLQKGEQILLQGLEIQPDLIRSSAAQLLLAFAKRANPDFIVEQEKWLLEVCQAVRGLPLALEFIGSAAHKYDLQGLHQRYVLQNKFQDSVINSVLEMSFVALSQTEQDVLLALVVLPNHTQIEVILAVSQANMDTIEQLYWQGWLEQSPLHSLHLHESVRQYLQPKRSTKAVLNLTNFYEIWLAQQLSKPQQDTWTDLKSHWQGLETAWQAGFEQGNWVYLEKTIWYYWQILEPLELFLNGLGMMQLETTMSATLQSAILTVRGWCEARLGRSNQALATLAAAANLYLHRHTLEAMALAQHSAGDFILSLPSWTKALEAHVLVGDQIGEARVLLHLGDIASENTENERAEHLFFDALQIARRNQNLALTAKALHLLGALAVHHGQLELGRSRYQEAIKHLEPLGMNLSVAKLINNIAVIDHMNHQIQAAREGYQKSLMLRRPLGDLKGIAQITANLAALEWDHGDRRESLHLHETALAERQRLGDARGMVNSHNCLCEVYLHFGLLSAAKEQAEQATHQAQQLGSEVLLHHCLLSYAAIYLHQQQLELATRYLAHPLRGQSSQECKFSAEPYALQIEAQLPQIRINTVIHQALRTTIQQLITECQHDAANAKLYSN